MNVEDMVMQMKLTDYWDLYRDNDQVTLDSWIEGETEGN